MSPLHVGGAYLCIAKNRNTSQFCSATSSKANPLYFEQGFNFWQGDVPAMSLADDSPHGARDDGEGWFARAFTEDCVFAGLVRLTSCEKERITCASVGLGS